MRRVIFFPRDRKKKLHYYLHGLFETFNFNESCKCALPSGTDLKICFLLVFFGACSITNNVAEG